MTATLPPSTVAAGRCCYCQQVNLCRQIPAHVGHTHPDHDGQHECLICWKCDGKKQA